MNIFSHINKFENNILFFENDKKIFYRDVLSFEKKFKSFKKDKLILFASDYTSEFLMTYISLMRKDLKIMLIDSNLDKKDILSIILSYKPNYIFSDRKLKLNLKNYERYLEFESSMILKNKKNENY